MFCVVTEFYDPEGQPVCRNIRIVIYCLVEATPCPQVKSLKILFK